MSCSFGISILVTGGTGFIGSALMPLLQRVEPTRELWLAGRHAPALLPAGACHVPLDLSAGTAFQARVWQALQAIPAGLTQSYSALAERIGAPSAVRASPRISATRELVSLCRSSCC